MPIWVLNIDKRCCINKKGVRNAMRFVLPFSVLFAVFSPKSEPVIRRMHFFLPYLFIHS